MTLLKEYPADLLKNSLAAAIDTWQLGWKACYLKELLKVWPARTVKSLLDSSFFERVSDTFNRSSMGIAFNSYDPRQGIECVHLNPRAKELLGGARSRELGALTGTGLFIRTLVSAISPAWLTERIIGLRHGATPALAGQISRMMAEAGATQNRVLEQASWTRFRRVVACSYWRNCDQHPCYRAATTVPPIGPSGETAVPVPFALAVPQHQSLVRMQGSGVLCDAIFTGNSARLHHRLSND